QRSEPLLLRKVVRVSAVRGALRSGPGHERLSGPQRAADGGGGVLRIPVPRGAHASGGRGHAGWRVRDGVSRPRLLRVDRTAALQLHARRGRILLLAVQGGVGAGAGSPSREMAV